MKFSKKQLSLTIIVAIILLSIGYVNVKLKDHKSFLFQLRELAFQTNYSQGQTQNFQLDLSSSAKIVRHENLGRDYMRSGDYDKAIIEYQKAVELAKQHATSEVIQVQNQKSPRAHLFAAYEKAGSYKEALEQIDWLLDHNPSESYRFELQTWKNVIMAEQDGQYEKAMKHIDIALNSTDLQKYKFVIQKFSAKRQELQQRLNNSHVVETTGETL